MRENPVSGECGFEEWNMARLLEVGTCRSSTALRGKPATEYNAFHGGAFHHQRYQLYGRIQRGLVDRDAVVTILQENGGVMHADEILEALNRQGVQFLTSDPKATVVTALIRLRDYGQVSALGKNRFQWKGEDDPFERGVSR
jgi:hypothetical protein